MCHINCCKSSESCEKLLLRVQHAVHERIRLEDLLDLHTTRPPSDYGAPSAVVGQRSQRPLAIRLTAEQQEVLVENPGLVRQFGLEVEQAGKSSCRLTQFPLCFASLDQEKREILLLQLGTSNSNTAY